MSLCLFWSLAHNWMEEANLSTNTHSANHKRRMLEKVKVSPFEMCCSGKEQLSIWVFFFLMPQVFADKPLSSMQAQWAMVNCYQVQLLLPLCNQFHQTTIRSHSPGKSYFSLATRGYQGLANQSADLCQWGLIRLMHKLHRWIKTQFNGHKKTKSNLS